MEKFDKLTAVAAPLPMVNVDTDMIIPARFLKTIKRTGLSEGLFYALRHDKDGNPKDFVLDRPAYRSAQILIVGDNFGCGSSREHAVWALTDYGFRAAIAPSFADIFYSNSFKNGFLPVQLPEQVVDTLFQQVHANEGYRLTVDLENQQVITPDGDSHAFEIDAGLKDRLLRGLDDIGATLTEAADAIRDYEARRAREAPWLFPERQ